MTARSPRLALFGFVSAMIGLYLLPIPLNTSRLFIIEQS